jgi:hypothetical protein
VFGDYNKNRELAEYIAEQFDLETLLELNDLTPTDVIEILLDRGLIEDYNTSSSYDES